MGHGYYSIILDYQKVARSPPKKYQQFHHDPPLDLVEKDLTLFNCILSTSPSICSNAVRHKTKVEKY